MKKTELKPFDHVLTRDSNDDFWEIDIFSHIDEKTEYLYRCLGSGYKQCIPYNEETQHLLGTTNEYKEPEIKKWEVKSSNGLFIEKFTSTELKQFIDTAVINNKDITNFSITRIF